MVEARRSNRSPARDRPAADMAAGQPVHSMAATDPTANSLISKNITPKQRLLNLYIKTYLYYYPELKNKQINNYVLEICLLIIIKMLLNNNFIQFFIRKMFIMNFLGVKRKLLKTEIF